MTRKPLDNYLRTYRRKAGLSQDEVAFLLGTTSGSKVSRYEKRQRKPSLETAWGYEVIFGLPARDLFAGSFAKVEKNIHRRAKLLIRRLENSRTGALRQRRLLPVRVLAVGSEARLEQEA